MVTNPNFLAMPRQDERLSLGSNVRLKIYENSVAKAIMINISWRQVTKRENKDEKEIILCLHMND